MIRTSTLESYAELLDGGHADLDIGADDRAEVASILRNVVQRATDFGHVAADGTVGRYVAYRMADRDDVSGHISWAPNLGRAKEIIANV